MIIDTTVQTPEVKRTMASKVGEPFGLMEKLRLGGVGSKRMRIEETSEHFAKYLSSQLDTVYCSLEIRKRGLVVHFKKYQTVYSWLVPEETLIIQDDVNYTLLSENFSLSIRKDRLYQENKKFLARIGTQVNTET